MQKMRALLRFLFSLVLLAVIVVAAGWFWAGRMDGRKPGRTDGRTDGTGMPLFIS